MLSSLAKDALKKALAPIFRRLGYMNFMHISWKEVGNLEAASALINTMQASRMLDPKEEMLPENQKVLVLAPHPDDEIIGCGGAVLKMLGAGCSVHVIYFTSDGTDVEAEEIEKVAKQAGFSYDKLGFLMKGLPLEPSKLKGLSEKMTAFKPDIILLPFMLDDHPDHRDVSFALLEIEKSLQDFMGVQVWAYQVYSCLPLNAVVRISDVIERKLDILRLYQSRFKPRDWCHYTKGLNAFNTRFLIKPTDQDYAECYYKTNLKSYLSLCKGYRNHTK